MKRILCAAAIFALCAAPAFTQTRAATPPVMPDRAETVGPIKILRLRPNMFMLVGPGGNSTVQVGDEGVLVVDTMTQEAGDAMVAAIRTLSQRPILQIISTHAHPDHVGGNEAVRKAGTYLATGNTRDGGGASILAFEETLNHMSAEGAPYAKAAWPTDTFFVKQKDLFMNGDAVQVMHQPAAHTDGDVLVLFRRGDVLVTGDVFTPNRYPMLDLQNGGSINGLIAGLNRIIDLAVPEFNEEGGTLIVPGHGRLCDESDVGDYRDMVTIVRDRVQDMVKKKATLDQVKAAKLTLDYDGVYGTPAYTGDMFVEAIYRSLAPAPPAAAPAAAKGKK
jgi:cyclase